MLDTPKKGYIIAITMKTTGAFMKKSKFVSGIFLIGYEQGKKVAEVDLATLSNKALQVILAHWEDINRTFAYDIRF